MENKPHNVGDPALERVENEIRISFDPKAEPPEFIADIKQLCQRYRQYEEALKVFMSQWHAYHTNKINALNKRIYPVECCPDYLCQQGKEALAPSVEANEGEKEEKKNG